MDCLNGPFTLPLLASGDKAKVYVSNLHSGKFFDIIVDFVAIVLIE